MATHARDPWYRITPERHLNDVRLRRLCKENAARALYYEGRHLMHLYGQPYGHLALHPGVAMTAEKIADLLNMLPGVVIASLKELFDSGLWQRTDEGVLFDPELIETMEAVLRNRHNGGLGGNPKYKKTPGSTPPSTGGSTPGSTGKQPRVKPTLTLSLPSSSPSPSPEEREREERGAAPTQEAFLASFTGEDIAEAFLRKKWAWFEGNNAWLDDRGALKNFRVIVRDWWADEDHEKWADPGETPPESRAAIEAALKKLPVGDPRRKPLLAKLNAA